MVTEGEDLRLRAEKSGQRGAQDDKSGVLLTEG